MAARAQAACSVVPFPTAGNGRRGDIPLSTMEQLRRVFDTLATKHEQREPATITPLRAVPRPDEE